MKRFISAAACFLALLLLLPSLTVYASGPDIAPGCMAVVYNPQSGKFLFSQNGGGSTEPTVTAKMVALLLIYAEFRTDMSAEITVTAESIRNVGTAYDTSTPMIGLTAGSTFTAQELISCAAVSWANDCINPLIYALCARQGIEYSDFDEKMTEYAESLGCKATLYKEPLGRAGRGSKTTAEDVALICSEFYNCYDLLSLSSAGYYSLRGSTIHNRNYLFSERIVSGCTLGGMRGMCAGQYASSGGYCLCSAYDYGALTYIFVIMNGGILLFDEEGNRYFNPSANPYADISALRTWVTAEYGYVTLCEKGDAVAELTADRAQGTDHLVLSASETVRVLLESSYSEADITERINYDLSRITSSRDSSGKTIYTISAPVTKGETLGMISYLYNGEVIGSSPLVASDNLDTDTVLDFFDKAKEMLFSPTALTIFRVLLILAALYVAYCIAAFAVRVVKKVKKDAAETKKQQKYGGKATSRKKPR